MNGCLFEGKIFNLEDEGESNVNSLETCILSMCNVSNVHKLNLILEIVLSSINNSVSMFKDMYNRYSNS